MLGKRPFGEDGLGNQQLWQGFPEPTLVRESLSFALETVGLGGKMYL